MTRRPAPQHTSEATPARSATQAAVNGRRHPRRRITAVAVTAAATLALTGCSAIGRPGAPTTETRDISGVTAVALSTSGNLTIETGAEAQLTVTAGENVMELLTSEVRDGVLVLDLEKGYWGRLGDVEYHLVLPEVDRLVLNGSGGVEARLSSTRELDVTVSGSGDLEATALDLDALAVTVEGSGSVTLEGTTANEDVRISGSGSLDAERLRSTNAVVLVEGSGSAKVLVTESLDASVEGSGSVLHTGGAHVTRDVSGSGGVTGS